MQSLKHFYKPDCFRLLTEAPSGINAATMSAQMTNNAPNTKGGPGIRFGLLVMCCVVPFPDADPFG